MRIMSTAKKHTPEQENAGAVKFLARKKTPRQSRATKETVVDIASPSSGSVEDVELPGNTSTPVSSSPAPKAPAKPTSPKSSSRSQLAKRDFSQRVRSDIHERLHDEHYRRRKDGEQAKIGDIADEALHLGLLQLEKRRR